MAKHVTPPLLKWRILVTLSVLIVWALGSFLYGSLEGPVMGHLAAGPGHQSVMTYSIGRAIELGFVPQAFGASAAIILHLVWVSYVRGRRAFTAAAAAALKAQA